MRSLGICVGRYGPVDYWDGGFSATGVRGCKLGSSGEQE